MSRVLIVMPAVLAILAVPSRANAGLPVVARGSLTVVPGATAVSVCADGFVDDGTTVAGVWTLTVTGTSALPIVRTGSGATFNTCVAYSKAGLPAGGSDSTLTFAAAGTSVVTSIAVGAATWVPVVGDNAASVGF